MQWPILFLGTCGTYYGFLFYSCKGSNGIIPFNLKGESFKAYFAD